MLKKFNNLLCILLAIYVTNAFSQESKYFWETHKTQVLISKRIEIEGKFVIQTFILDYIPNKFCNISASILTHANSNSLGNVKSKKTRDADTFGNQLRFFVDGNEIKYIHERISRVEYEHGVEFGVIAPAVLITAIQNSSGNLEVFLGNLSMIKISNSSGFKERNLQAFQNCRQIK
jgi:hypothetical protein